MVFAETVLPETLELLEKLMAMPEFIGLFD
jgi:hypothetical protein